MIRSGLTKDPIRPEEVLSSLASSSDGAVLLFLGVVRDHNQGRDVSGITYEAYTEMAEKVLRDITTEARERHGTDRIVVLHRTGTLAVGEVSTAIAVATPHREEAYVASRFIIEEIKQRLPVWKQEAYVEGDRAWVVGHEPPAAGGGVEEAADPAGGAS